MTRTPRKISKQALKSIAPGETLWDTDLKGFGARRQKDCVSFFLKCRYRGRQRWVTIGRLGQPWTVETARAEVLRRLSGIADGIDPRRSTPTSSLTIAEGFQRYLIEHAPKLKPRTLEEYQRLANNDIVPALGTLHVDEDVTPDIVRFHTKLANTPRKANFALVLLSGFFTWAEEASLRPEGKNPCTGITKYRETKRERFLNTKELKRLGEVLAQCEATSSESAFTLAAIRLLILTGARRNEILTLKWAYVDKQRAQLRLPDSKSGAKIIRLSKPALAELSAIPKVKGNDYVIVGDKKGRHLVNLQDPWQRIRKAAGIEDVRLHDLRHSFASVAAEGGASLGIIGKLLGHTQVVTTGRYAHLTEATVDQANEDVGERISDVLRPSNAAANLQQTQDE